MPKSIPIFGWLCWAGSWYLYKMHPWRRHMCPWRRGCIGCILKKWVVRVNFQNGGRIYTDRCVCVLDVLTVSEYPLHSLSPGPDLNIIQHWRIQQTSVSVKGGWGHSFFYHGYTNTPYTQNVQAQTGKAGGSPLKIQIPLSTTPPPRSEGTLLVTTLCPRPPLWSEDRGY